MNFLERIQEVLITFSEDNKKIMARSELGIPKSNSGDIKNNLQTSSMDEDRSKRSKMLGNQASKSYKDLTQSKAGQLREFFGELHVEIFQPGSNESVMVNWNEAFGPIILEMGSDDLYGCWERSMVSELNEFRHDNGNIMKNVLKFDWIKTCPMSLCFQ